ncbi:hypothetical protein ARSEF1564_010154 [Beauveria bassiana]
MRGFLALYLDWHTLSNCRSYRAVPASLGRYTLLQHFSSLLATWCIKMVEGVVGEALEEAAEKPTEKLAEELAGKASSL